MLKLTEKEKSKLHASRKLTEYDDDVISYIERRLDREQQQLESGGRLRNV